VHLADMTVLDQFVVVKKDGQYKGFIKLYARDTYTINDRYFEPPVLLNVHYQTSLGSGVAKGRQSRYYPPKKNTE